MDLGLAILLQSNGLDGNEARSVLGAKSLEDLNIHLSRQKSQDLHKLPLTEVLLKCMTENKITRSLKHNLGFERNEVKNEIH